MSRSATYCSSIGGSTPDPVPFNTFCGTPTGMGREYRTPFCSRRNGRRNWGAGTKRTVTDGPARDRSRQEPRRHTTLLWLDDLFNQI
ncbi:hypothetical protein GCM10022625_46530 [Deinococcus aetherius]